MQTSQTDTKQCPSTNGEGFRLSYQQRRILGHAQAANPSERSAARLSSQCVLRIEGQLDVARLQHALQQIVDRHDILRTTFHFPAGHSLPVQAVSPDGRAEWHELDLLACDADEQRAQFEARRKQDFREPFQLAEGSLLRATLVALTASEYVLVFTLPALCADSASLSNIAKEIHSLYNDVECVENSGAPVQYIQFAEWQQSVQHGEDAELGKAHWSQHRDLSPLSLPLQRIPPSSGTFASRMVTISSRIGAALGRIDRVDAFLLGCWLTPLWRVSGQSPIRIGVTCHGRSFEELQGVVGPVARVVPVSCALHDQLHFRDLAGSIAEKFDEAEEWQEYYERSSSEGPCESVCFEWTDWPVEAEVSSTRFSLVSLQSQIDHCHIGLAITRSGEAFFASLHYDPQVLMPDYIDCLASQFSTLVCFAIDNPDAMVEQLPLMSEEERRFVVEECNNTRSDYARDASLHQLFAEQAVRTPHRVAVTFGDANLTYAELDKRANQLAHCLREFHVAPEVRVGIFMHRSLEMMVGLLGILKAGGAYVPLDPVYPPERLAFMLADSQVSVVLTDGRLRQLVPIIEGLQILCLDDAFEQIACIQPSYEPRSGVCPNNIAYALYTSGSTGKPKGVLVSHRGLINYLSWCCKAYEVENGAGSALHSSIGFDATITALFPPLLVGRSVELVHEADGVDGLYEALQRSDGFSLIKITPAHLSLLNEAIVDAKVAARARLLVIGGDALSSGRLTSWRRLAPETRFINEYGPTETVVGCCTHEAREADFAGESVPIGRPIANTRLYVLDSRFSLRPIGVPGELYIGGDGVSRGYLNRPALTAERFLPDPFSGKAGARLYRTGDLTIRFPDGILSFLGRLDYQVKIRSYRIELGEIETQIEQHAMVVRCVVTAHTESSGEKSLVAYIEAVTTKPPTVEELRAFLLTRLPEYMIPTHFVMLDVLPLTAHGKVDRNRLPDPMSVRISAAEPFVAPQTAAEQILADIWCKILRLDRISIHDDFFRSGGDSILSILVVARAAKAGLRFTTRDLFQHSTIAELASLASSKAPAAASWATGSTVPLTPIQHWFFDQCLANPHHFNQAVMLEVKPSLSINLLRLAIDRLVDHHDALRLRFTPEVAGEPTRWNQAYATAEGTAEVCEVDLTEKPSAEQQATIMARTEEAQAGLDITHGPMLRAVLFRCTGDGPNRLLLVIHHLVVDGVSWRILLDDLATACRQLADNERVQFPANNASFHDCAIRMKNYAASGALAGESKYWLILPTTMATLPIDYSFSDDDNIVASSARVHIELDCDQTSALLREVPATYRTRIDDVLLTAIVHACAHWTGSRSLCIDLESHGRPDGQSEEGSFDELDLSRTVGWFTSIFPACLTLEGDSLGEALKGIKEQLRQVPNRGIGYGAIRYLSPDAALRGELAKLPKPPISFNYLGILDDLVSEPILGVAVENVGDDEARTNRRLYLLDLLAQVKDGRLQVEIIYSNAVHRRATIEKFALDILEKLQQLIAHCLSPNTGGFTPSDFPEAGLNQQELDRLVADLG